MQPTRSAAPVFARVFRRNLTGRNGGWDSRFVSSIPAGMPVVHGMAELDLSSRLYDHTGVCVQLEVAMPFEEDFRKAHTRLRGTGLNLVSLAALRQALSVDRETFDREVLALRHADKLRLHTFEGRHGRLSEEERQAAIVEGDRVFVYAALVGTGGGW